MVPSESTRIRLRSVSSEWPIKNANNLQMHPHHDDGDNDNDGDSDALLYLSTFFCFRGHRGPPSNFPRSISYASHRKHKHEKKRGSERSRPLVRNRPALGNDYKLILNKGSLVVTLEHLRKGTERNHNLDVPSLPESAGASTFLRGVLTN